MDIYCITCGEPWEIDVLHETAEEKGNSFKEVLHDFYSRGCNAVDGRSKEGNCNDDPISEAPLYMSALIDILGDDVDGIASGMEDAEYDGLF